MKIDSKNGCAIVFEDKCTFHTFLEDLKTAYTSVKNENLIVNLSAFPDLTTEEVLQFRKLSDAHRAGKKSLVLVTDRISFDEVPEELQIVPTLQEAKDLIEMEEIERDLEL